MGHLVACYLRSLASLTLLTRFAVLRFATLALPARSIHELAHSLCPLPRGMVEIHERVFTLKTRFAGTNAFLSSLQTRPRSSVFPLVVIIMTKESITAIVIKNTTHPITFLVLQMLSSHGFVSVWNS